MEPIKITKGDFLKNAGIVGMYHMFHVLKARKGEDFWIDEEEQVLCISREFALNADWTDMYFKAFVEIYGSMCTYQEIINRIEKCKGIIEKGDGIEKNSSIKDDLKYITDRCCLVVTKVVLQIFVTKLKIRKCMKILKVKK